MGALAMVAAGAASRVQAQVRPAAPATQVTADEIDAAVAKGLEYLWSKQQPNGLFSPAGEYKIAGQVVYGGYEVMTMTVLAYAGEPLAKPEMQKALKALMGLELGLNATHSPYTYTLGFRLIALAEIYRSTPDEKMKTLLRQCMKSDANKLAELQLATNGWSYSKPSDVWDFSNTQIAVLGLQQAVSCGIELKSDVFIKALELYLEKQMPDGGWGYGRPGDARAASSYGSMTAAGTVSVFLLRDLLNPGAGCPCKGNASSGKHMPKADEAINRSLKWLDSNFSALNPKDSAQDYLPFYWLYTVERVSIATGFKYLGTHDWYREGAAYIVKQQGTDGSWTDVPNTAFALLFLIKGRGPVLMNKLQFDGEWDRHPHDAEHLADFVGKLKEQRFNWQVVNLNIPVEELHDAPILYVSAETPLKLSEGEKKKLRDFTDSGGTILFEASCGDKAVDLAWRKSCQEIWPEWELKALDKDHPLWAADAKIVANRPLLQGVSDGLRTFLFYAPRDISCAWNTLAVAKEQSLFELGGNLYAYTTDRGKLRAKLAARETGLGKKYAGEAVTRGPQDTITVARVKHGGDWYVGKNYHPWECLARQFQVQSGAAAPHATTSVSLTIKETEPVTPGEALPAGTTVLYLCGRTGCELGENGGKWLKDFAASGGFIFAESVLGDKRFDEPVRAALESAGLKLKALPTDSPLLTGQLANGAKGYNVSKVAYTFALQTERVGQPAPSLVGLYQGDKLVGIYSPFDVMFSQIGCAAFGNRGYAADDARALAANIALLVSQGSAAPVPPRPGK
jgi:hypothetical protein